MNMEVLDSLFEAIDTHTKRINKLDKLDAKYEAKLDKLESKLIRDIKLQIDASIPKIDKPKDGRDGRDGVVDYKMVEKFISKDIAEYMVKHKDTFDTLLPKEVKSYINGISKTLKGTKGDKGDKGDTGKQGIPGKPGKDGKDGKPGRDGINGKDGKDGKSVDKSELTKIIDDKIKKLEDKTYSTPMKFNASASTGTSITPLAVKNMINEAIADGGVGGGSGTYTNATPVPKTIGGITAGTTFDNVDIADIIGMLLYPYQAPTFSTFSIAGISSKYEVGDAISSGGYTASWSTTNNSNINVGSISISCSRDGSLASGLTNDGSEGITLSEYALTSPGANTWTINGINSEGNGFSRNITVNWYWAVYYGESASTNLTEADVEGLRVKTLKSNSSGVYDMNGGDYKWICYPTSMGLKSTFLDVSTGFPVAMESAETVSVTNSFGHTTDYYCHRTTNALGGSVSIGVS
jgi:hypothetical protein